MSKMLVGFAKAIVPEGLYMFDYVHVHIERKKEGTLG